MLFQYFARVGTCASASMPVCGRVHPRACACARKRECPRIRSCVGLHLLVFVRVCLYMRVPVRVHSRVHVRVCTRVCMRAPAYMCKSVHVCTRTCLRAFVRARLWACACMFPHICAKYVPNMYQKQNLLIRLVLSIAS